MQPTEQTWTRSVSPAPWTASSRALTTPWAPEETQPAAVQTRIRSGLRVWRSFTARAGSSVVSMRQPSFDVFERSVHVLFAGHLSIVDHGRRQATGAQAARRQQR